MPVNDPILRDYFQFTGIIRDVDMESDIGPMWRENSTNGKLFFGLFDIKNVHSSQSISLANGKVTSMESR